MTGTTPLHLRCGHPHSGPEFPPRLSPLADSFRVRVARLLCGAARRAAYLVRRLGRNLPGQVQHSIGRSATDPVARAGWVPSASSLPSRPTSSTTSFAKRGFKQLSNSGAATACSSCSPSIQATLVSTSRQQLSCSAQLAFSMIRSRVSFITALSSLSIVGGYSMANSRCLSR